jgi:putative drug exporter of the RND superfamily
MYRRRRRVVAGWVVLLIGLVALNASAGGEFLDEFSLPGSESQQAVDFLESHGFENRAGSGGQVVFQTDQGVQDAAVQQAMEGLFARFEADIPDAQVVSPYTRKAAARSRRATRGSPMPRSTWATGIRRLISRPGRPPAAGPVWTRRASRRCS